MIAELEENYSMFSRVYDEVMDQSLYDDWLAFSERHFGEHTHKILELACGSGILSEKFIAAHYDVTGVDLSKDMLELARKRVTNADFEVGDMRKLAFQSDFDAVTCFSDSLCYLVDLDEVKQAFAGVYRALRLGGTFIFDVHSLYQMDELWDGFSYHENAEDFAFVWDTYCGDVPHSIQHELTFFVQEEDGRFVRKDELHEERTYPLEDWQGALEEVGFKNIEVFADWTDDTPKSDSKRWFFVARK
ncbi:MAG: class I SAM-dependent methyltransferase [Streptococcaceae bacterium]|jgi:SAM-dependent methyltransferase|nr:class I SAM-dependent methyltransferase [Streptococcaceae bacterium]